MTTFQAATSFFRATATLATCCTPRGETASSPSPVSYSKTYSNAPSDSPDISKPVVPNTIAWLRNLCHGYVSAEAVSPRCGPTGVIGGSRGKAAASGLKHHSDSQHSSARSACRICAGYQISSGDGPRAGAQSGTQSVHAHNAGPRIRIGSRRGRSPHR